jgi:hypothetical protein
MMIARSIIDGVGSAPNVTRRHLHRGQFRISGAECIPIPQLQVGQFKTINGKRLQGTNRKSNISVNSNTLPTFFDDVRRAAIGNPTSTAPDFPHWCAALPCRRDSAVMH